MPMIKNKIKEIDLLSFHLRQSGKKRHQLNTAIHINILDYTPYAMLGLRLRRATLGWASPAWRSAA
uniref:Uncharacterized protein n=1 Tax=Romanomermis culicivorax TaxID=13658 RepID=A0A915I8D4_ROMCU